MITRPSTQELLDGVRVELRDVVVPALSGPPAVAVQMLDAVLAVCARRAAHEIAWMLEEGAAIESALSSSTDQPVVDALADYRSAASSGSVHLDDVQRAYSAAGEALGRAIEAAYERSDAVEVERLRALLQARADREVEIMGEFGFVGRG